MSVGGSVVAAPARFDFGLAVLVATLALIEVAAAPPPESELLAVASALGTTLPIAWRSSAPAAAAIAASIALALAVALGTDTDQPTITTFAPLVSLFALGEHGSRRELLGTGGLCVVILTTTGVWGDFGKAILAFSLAIGSLSVGAAVRVLNFETDILETEVSALRGEQEQRTRAAVAAERQRISRELHDVIGHSISVMGIQAGAVRRVLPPELEREREMLEAIERTGRDSVTEMHRLIGLLANENGASTPGAAALARLAALADDVRAAGLEVELELGEGLDEISPGRALAGYRIVQEALTNVLKHAPGSHVAVSVRREGTELEIQVVNSRSGAPTSEIPDGGRGLIGMRERSALYGGRFEAGPTADGGFRVAAAFPAEQA